MTKPDTITAGEETAGRPLLGQVLFYVGVSFGVGALGAGAKIFAEGGFNTFAAAVIGTVAALGAFAVFLAIRVGNFDAPNLSTKTGRSQAILLGCVMIGAVIGFYIVTSGAMDRFQEGDFSISQTEAAVGLVLLFIVALPLGFIRERAADDFERAASREAAYWTFTIYIYGYMAWAIGAAGGLFPPVHHGIIFLVVVFAFLGLWAVKRSG